MSQTCPWGYMRAFSRKASTSPHLISSHLISSHLISSHLVSSHLYAGLERTIGHEHDAMTCIVSGIQLLAFLQVPDLHGARPECCATNNPALGLENARTNKIFNSRSSINGLRTATMAWRRICYITSKAGHALHIMLQITPVMIVVPYKHKANAPKAPIKIMLNSGPLMHDGLGVHN